MSIVSEGMNNLEILLSNGKTIVVDDESYSTVDDYSGAVTHIFTSKKMGTIYTVNDENVVAFGEKWTADRLERLVGSEEERIAHDPMFG